MKPFPIALGARLQSIPGINTIGFKPNFQDYTCQEQKMILTADTIYFPTAFYAGLFHASGKKIFPSFHTYTFALDKIKQTTMFNLLGIPHPRTAFFFGKKQKQTILHHFDFPFIAKIPRGSAKGSGVYLIQTADDLAAVTAGTSPAYIQEYLPIDRDMRIVIIGSEIRLAYWRIAREDTFKTNLSQGGTISFDPLPSAALELALSTAVRCGWNDVGIDIISHNHQYYVLEGNMKYGTKGFEKAGINYKQMLADLILSEAV